MSRVETARRLVVMFAGLFLKHLKPFEHAILPENKKPIQG